MDFFPIVICYIIFSASAYIADVYVIVKLHGKHSLGNILLEFHDFAYLAFEFRHNINSGNCVSVSPLLSETRCVAAADFKVNSA